MHARTNRQVRLKSRPAGIPDAENVEIVEAPVPALAKGQILVRNISLTAGLYRGENLSMRIIRITPAAL